MSVDYGDGAIFAQYKNECWLRERSYLDTNQKGKNRIDQKTDYV